MCVRVCVYPYTHKKTFIECCTENSTVMLHINHMYLYVYVYIYKHMHKILALIRIKIMSIIVKIKN